MFLTVEEIAELTGKKRRDSQRTVLNAIGVQHKVRPDGSLVILRSHVEKEFDGSPPMAKSKKKTEPNWDAIG